MNRRGKGGGVKELELEMAFEVSLSKRIYNSATVSYSVSILNVPVVMEYLT